MNKNFAFQETFDDSSEIITKPTNKENEDQISQFDKIGSPFEGHDTKPEEAELLDYPFTQTLSSNKIKEYNREVSKKIPPEVIEELIEERQAIVLKKYSEGIEPDEERRLKLIEWKLDRIEDAESGEHLDRLEYYVKLHEEFAEEIDKLLELSDWKWSYAKGKRK